MRGFGLWSRQFKMEVLDSAAWIQVPSVLRCALTTLAQTSASMSKRVAQVEHDLEAERRRFAEATSRLVSRVEALEKRQGDERLWRDVEERCRRIEEDVRDELDAARADAAAT